MLGFLNALDKYAGRLDDTGSDMRRRGCWFFWQAAASLADLPGGLVYLK